MQTFAQKQSQPRKPATSSFARPAASRPDHPTGRQLLLQLAIGNQRAQGTPRPDAGLDAGSSAAASPPVEHDPAGLAVDSGELEQPPVHVSARPPDGLPAATPAWTRDGEIHLGPAGLFMPPEQQKRMLRHEAFHSLHQRIAPVSDAPQARAGAERLATDAERGFGGVRVPMTPAPALLAFPPQAHAPWDRVFLGHTHVIAEVAAGGVAARIQLSYKDLGITRAPEPRTYHCGKHPSKSGLKKLAERLKKAANLAADLNSRTPSGFPLKTAVVAISRGANSSFRESGGQGVIVVKQEEPWEDTIAHEGAHGIFASHLGEPRTALAPDPLAKGITELFLALKNTPPVSMATRRFDPKRLPSLKDDGKTAGRPAGHVMVMDMLWAQKGSSPGHPWDNADEFFASAFGAFQQDRPLFEQILAHYGKVDAAIPPLARKLLALLATVGNQTAVAALPAPSDPKAVDAELGRIPRMLPLNVATDVNSARLVDPTTLPGPTAITCPGAKPTPAPVTAPAATVPPPALDVEE